MAVGDGQMLHGNGSDSAQKLPSDMQLKAAFHAEEAEIHCMASPSEDLDGEEATPWEWESVSEAGCPVVLQVVLCDPSLCCSRCAESHPAAASCPSAHRGARHPFAPAQVGDSDSWDSWGRRGILQEEVPAPPEVWDLEACQEFRDGLRRQVKPGVESVRSTSSDGSCQGRTQWRHLLTPISSPFSLACSDSSPEWLQAEPQPAVEVVEVAADAEIAEVASCSGNACDAWTEESPVSAVHVDPHLHAAECAELGEQLNQTKPRSVHSMETGIAGSSDTNSPGKSSLIPVASLARTSLISSKGVTPLHVAAELGSTDVVHNLLKSGAAVDAATSDGFTPLHGAANMGCAETVASLISARADVSVPAIDGSTALHGAARHGHTETVVLLLEKGSVLDAADHNGGFTPLHDAAHAGHQACP